MDLGPGRGSDHWKWTWTWIPWPWALAAARVWILDYVSMQIRQRALNLMFLSAKIGPKEQSKVQGANQESNQKLKGPTKSPINSEKVLMFASFTFSLFRGGALLDQFYLFGQIVSIATAPCFFVGGRSLTKISAQKRA